MSSGLAATEVEDHSDSHLVVAAHAGDQLAVEQLMSRYRGAVRARATNYFLAGADRDDLCQEGMIGLYKAIRDFDPDHGASFAAFADLCITRQMLTAIKMATRLKHAPLNSYLSIDQHREDEHGRSFTEVAMVEEDADPLESLVADDAIRTLMGLVDEVLSSLEARVLRLYVDGRSYQEIADLLGRGTKSIDNALQRIKRKLEAALQD